MLVQMDTCAESGAKNFMRFFIHKDNNNNNDEG